MPVITIEGAHMSKEKKAKLVKQVVGVASAVMEIPEDAFVTIIRENDYDNIGNGTQLLSDRLGQ
ncbi:MAG: 4-oxalocrotonate tautomerase DmpI [Bacillota bacterium]|nr:4-oxalocrotonate tautomerase DmpI [Bacillota bacterium]MDW7676254.1 4-oxalocrotonate tautomerase DmpI [Bacillota bacterium]